MQAGRKSKSIRCTLHLVRPVRPNPLLSSIDTHSLDSVNSVSWAPHELGAILACASSDGKISVLTFKGAVKIFSSCSPPKKPNPHTRLEDGQWGADVFEAHAIGCNAVSWAPAARAGSLLAPNTGGRRPSPVKRFASAGCDNIVKIWGFSEETQAWVEEDVLEGHTDWVRDVAWAPNIGLPRSYIATASQVRFSSLFLSTSRMCKLTLLYIQDKTVLVWTKDSPTAQWVKTALDPSVSAAPSAGATPGKFPDVVWRTSWSLAGNVLAVSCGDGKVTLWKENLKSGWECVSDVSS